MVKRMTSAAMLAALAMIFSYIETMIPINFGIPGIKLGLANVVAVVALYLLEARWAFVISGLRIALVAFTFGNISMGVYSLAGGMLSLAAMVILYKKNGYTIIGVSVIGGVFHNIGQLAVAVVTVSNINLILYFPVLLFAGVITGYLIGVAASLVLPRIDRFYSERCG